MGFYQVLRSFTRFYGVLLGLTRFYWVLMGFTRYCRVLLGFARFYWVLLGFSLILLSFYKVLPSRYQLLTRICCCFCKYSTRLGLRA